MLMKVLPKGHFTERLLKASSYESAFSGQNAIRGSSIDLHLCTVVEHLKQTTPWRCHKIVTKAWEFNYPEHLRKIILLHGTSNNKEKKEGTVCAFCKDDINQAPLFKVTFDNPFSEIEINKTQYLQGRLSYLEVHPDEEDQIDEALYKAASRQRKVLTDEEKEQAKKKKEVIDRVPLNLLFEIKQFPLWLYILHLLYIGGKKKESCSYIKEESRESCKRSRR